MKVLLTILFFSILAVGALVAAPVSGTLVAAPPDHAPAATDLTISYSISLRLKRGNAGIGEIYNGGIQTFFAGKQEARIRLASLMRIESVFATFDNGRLKRVTLIKESGTNKHRTVLNPEQWDQYNSKYKDAACHLTEDTALILKHICKKAVITLKDGRQITAWYYGSNQRTSFSCLQPAFSGIPGIVLKYEYTYRKKTIVYTATSVSQEPISAGTFTPPTE